MNPKILHVVLEWYEREDEVEQGKSHIRVVGVYDDENKLPDMRTDEYTCVRNVVQVFENMPMNRNAFCINNGE